MTEWIIPCNVKYYDVTGAFKKLKRVDWKQSAKNINVNDIVYIYVGSPFSSIKYKCLVTKVNLNSIEIDDSEFVIIGDQYVNYGKHMELEFIREYDDNVLSLSVLSEHGMKGRIQGPRRADPEISKLISSIS